MGIILPMTMRLAVGSIEEILLIFDLVIFFNFPLFWIDDSNFVLLFVGILLSLIDSRVVVRMSAFWLRLSQLHGGLEVIDERVWEIEVLYLFMSL